MARADVDAMLADHQEDVRERPGPSWAALKQRLDVETERVRARSRASLNDVVCVVVAVDACDKPHKLGLRMDYLLQREEAGLACVNARGECCYVPVADLVEQYQAS
jgi:hypothetical protein